MVHSARGLRAAQAGGKQDPLVKLSLLSGGEQVWSDKTEAAEDAGAEAEWQQQFTAPLRWHPRDRELPMLHVAVANDDWKAMFSTTMGECLLDVAPFMLHAGQPMDAWVPLNGQRGEVRLLVQFIPDSASAKVPFAPELLQGIRGTVHSGEVDVHVVAARQLRDVEGLFGGEQDP